MLTITTNGVEYDIMGENLKCMEENGLSKTYVSRRLLHGWTLNEACKVPKHIRLEDYREEQKIKQMDAQERRVRTQIKKNKHKEEHPWLYDGTPQVHPRSEYVANLMTYDAFPKVVK